MLLAFSLGVANAFDAPARQAFVVELVEREDLGNAIALNSTMFNLGAAIGPAIAGVVYAVLGPGWCFTINGASFIAVISALLLMRLKPKPPRVRTDSAFADLKGGLRYMVFKLPDLASRLNGGLVLTLHPLDDEERLAALQLRAQLRGFELAEETAEYLLRRLPRNMSSLCAFLDELDEASLVAQRRLTVPFVKAVIRRGGEESGQPGKPGK